MSETATILIVDDEAIIVDILKRRFQRLGFRVKTAYNGNQGIAILKEEEVDVIICDIKMPFGPSGSDVLKVAQEFNPDSHFVAISGHLMSDDSVRSIMENGASLFIKKPFPSLTEVTEQIADLIQAD